MSLYWQGLKSEVRSLLAAADDHIYVLAPFIQLDTLSQILPARTGATIVTSWRPDHLLSGVASLSLFDICGIRESTALYIHPRIHLKLYARDITRSNNAALIGSANVTERGLGDGPDANAEILHQLAELSLNDRVAIQRLVAESTRVDSGLHQQYVDWLEEAQQLPPPIELDLLPPLPTNSAARKHLVTDLPLTDDPHRLWQLATGDSPTTEWWEEDALVHDLALYGGDPCNDEPAFLAATATRFFANSFVVEVLDAVGDDGLFFGAMKEWIQNNCDDVPTPNRRELTETVQALMRWVAALAPDRFEIIRPRHSECLRKRR